MNLNGQTALITGASSGIGQAIAVELGAQGVNVFINFHSDEQGANTTLEEIKKRNGHGTLVRTDVSKESDVINMFNEITSAGQLDILVNNSGIQDDSPFAEMSVEKWNHVINTNLTGYFLCAREAVKAFRLKDHHAEKSKATGKIIFISSVHDKIPWAGHVNYASSKGGIDMLMKSLALELAPEKIRVNSVSPGAIRTNINTDAWETKDALNKLLKLIPYGRIGEPHDIAKVTAWLASDESDYITGTTIYVDGGMTLYPGFAHNG
jgi:glucose 1-dehydrogenase